MHHFWLLRHPARIHQRTITMRQISFSWELFKLPVAAGIMAINLVKTHTILLSHSSGGQILNQYPWPQIKVYRLEDLG